MGEATPIFSGFCASKTVPFTKPWRQPAKPHLASAKRQNAPPRRICLANPGLAQPSKAHIHNCGRHHASPELSLKRDRALTKAHSKSPLRLSRCNSCGITASFRRDFGDFCRARQKLLAKRACEASRAKQILTLQTLAVSQSKSPSSWAKPNQSLADFAPAKPCL